MNNAFKVIEDAAVKALNEHQTLSSDRCFKSGGHNGPYFDIETPVRNTSHWLISLSILYAETGKKYFYDLAEQLCNFLLQPGVYEENGVLIQRQKTGKDWCNGVIGQAWVIEALAIAGKLLDRADAVTRAHQLANVFTFSKTAKAWVKIDQANGKKRVDYTLNHQLWYAAAIALLDDRSLNAQIIEFFDSLDSGSMRVRSDGIISHLLYTNTPKGLALRFRYWLSELKSWNLVRAKEVGYHLYNLHPLARLKSQFSEHAIFGSQLLTYALDTAFSDEFVSNLDDNKYAYPYNSPAFEYPLIARLFQYQSEVCDKTWQKQMLKTFDDDVNGFLKNCPDPMTLNARLYEWLLDIYYAKYLEGRDEL